jgi:hypothetical protein
MYTHPCHDVRGRAAAVLLTLGLAPLAAGCGDAPVPLGPADTPTPLQRATVDVELNPQPEPPSLLTLPYELTAVGRGEFHGELGSCQLQATLTIVATSQTATHVRWSFQAVAPGSGETLGGELFGILNWTTGQATANGEFSSSLPAVQFRVHDDGRFTAGADGELIQFGGLVSLNPQPEPPSDTAVPPNPCVTGMRGAP